MLVSGRRGPWVPGRFGFPLGVALGVIATVLALAIGARAQPVLLLLLMVAVVDAAAMLTTVRATLATTAVCWCLHAGVVLGEGSRLAFTPRSGRDALVLLLVALSALGFASMIRSVRPQPDPVPYIPEQRQGEPSVSARC